MTVIRPNVNRLHHFFRSGPLPCPYLPGRVERKLFTRLSGPDAAALNSILSQAGFRRSHDIVYRPVCPGCRACVPVRIPVDRFAPNRTQRRIAKANADLSATPCPPRDTVEQYELFRRYQRNRHEDSDMARMSQGDFSAMVEEGAAAAGLHEFRTPDGRLVGVILADRLSDGFSAVYSFFDPEDGQRSMGTYMILALVEMARREGLPHVYLGYWISDCRKMAYKARFRPVETLTADGWRVLDEG
jgi:arginine-tRNA-protein transferase